MKYWLFKDSISTFKEFPYPSCANFVGSIEHSVDWQSRFATEHNRRFIQCKLWVSRNPPTSRFSRRPRAMHIQCTRTFPHKSGNNKTLRIGQLFLWMDNPRCNTSQWNQYLHLILLKNEKVNHPLLFTLRIVHVSAKQLHASCKIDSFQSGAL